jgi:protein-tyrosine phosphatase
VKKVLFLCTGNYFRSRFAEVLFNHLAVEQRLEVRAVSAGLAPDCHTRNPGPISPHTRAGLEARGITLAPPRSPVDATATDFVTAALIVAVKQSEHLPMIAARFPRWADRVRYWHVDDVPQVPAAQALERLDQLVRALVAELKAESGG